MLNASLICIFLWLHRDGLKSKKQHQKKSQRGSINIPAKQKKRTPWQMYLKQFGDLEGMVNFV